MDRYSIIKLKKKGKSDRAVARDLGIDRKTVAKYWKNYKESLDSLSANCSETELLKIQEEIVNAPQYDASRRTPYKYNESIDRFLDEILETENEKSRLLGNHKQHLTNAQIYDMVKEAGFDIGLTVVSDHIKQKRDRKKEVFIRQEYDYGERCEYDFGEVKLVIGGIAGTYHLAVIASPASNHRWAYLYTNQKKDVFLDSHVRYFQLRGGVPKEMVYDNMKNVVHRFIGKNEKELNTDLLKMALYYGFEINVTNCFSGNEKGYVENSVKELRKDIFAKRYRFENLEDAQVFLEKELIRINKDSFVDEERPFMNPAKPPLDLAVYSRNKVNKYSFIRVDNNFYSVPEHLVGHRVDVKQYVSKILVYAGGHLVAEHKKVDGFGQMQVEILHYLDTFERKPGALKNAKALKSKEALKTIYDSYFSTNPKKFIALLREHAQEDYQQLVTTMETAGKNPAIYENSSDAEMEDNILRNTKAQLKLVTGLYATGGVRDVN